MSRDTLVSVEAVGHAAAEERAPPAVARYLLDPDPAVRLEAVKALAPLGAAAVPTLIGVLAEPDAPLRREAAAALGRIGPDACAAVPALMTALKDATLKVRLAAATALGALGPDARVAIAALATAMKGSHLVLARLAAQALSRIGPTAVPTLVDLLASPDRYVRREAAWALGEIGPAAIGSVAGAAALQPIFSPKKPAERSADSDQQATAVVPLRREDLIESWPPVALPAARSDAPRDALTALTAALTDDDAKVRSAAALSLTRLHGTGDASGMPH